MCTLWCAAEEKACSPSWSYMHQFFLLLFCLLHIIIIIIIIFISSIILLLSHRLSVDTLNIQLCGMAWLDSCIYIISSCLSVLEKTFLFCCFAWGFSLCSPQKKKNFVEFLPMRTEGLRTEGIVGCCTNCKALNLIFVTLVKKMASTSTDLKSGKSKAYPLHKHRKQCGRAWATFCKTENDCVTYL